MAVFREIRETHSFDIAHFHIFQHLAITVLLEYNIFKAKARDFCPRGVIDLVLEVDDIL